MRYDDTIERSAEFLRQALPYMSKQSAALTPVSYAVWYEYVSGRNEALRAQLDRILASGARLDDLSTRSLFTQFIADVDPGTAQRVTDGLQRALTGMVETAEAAGSQTERFGSSLSRLSDQFSEAEDQAAQAAAIGSVLESTREMQSAVSGLQDRLKESQNQIQALKQEVARARTDALIDGLTDLANRRAFDQCLEGCLSDVSAQTGGLCLVMLDIDHFKRVNDTHGHVFGDQVIRAVAQVLKASVKGQDTAARIGGEEFAIILPTTPLNGAFVVAEKIRNAIGASRIRRGQQALTERVTVSLGVAAWRPGESATRFVERADAALYASKKGGRDRVTLES